MIEVWGWHLLQAIGNLFMNPLFYWAFILLILSGYRRIKRERHDFGMKIFGYFSEAKHTIALAFLASLLISLISLTLGFTWTSELLLLLTVVTILLSITGSFAFLSPVYTIGLTSILLVLLAKLPIEYGFSMSRSEIDLDWQIVSLVLILALLLFVEALLIYRARASHVYPSLHLSDRGAWLGQQQLKRMTVLPLMMFMPSDQASILHTLLPYFHLGSYNFSLTIVPFFVGTQFSFRYQDFLAVKGDLAKRKLFLAIIVMGLAIGSYFYFYLSFFTILVAVLGNEWITYRHRIRNKFDPPYFSPLNQGMKVLAVLPGSRADELGIEAGEVILKVNGVKVTESKDFYEALQISGAFFKLELTNQAGELRFIQSAFYAEDHHELGLIFPEAPHRLLQKERYESLQEKEKVIS